MVPKKHLQLPKHREVAGMTAPTLHTLGLFLPRLRDSYTLARLDFFKKVNNSIEKNLCGFSRIFTNSSFDAAASLRQRLLLSVCGRPCAGMLR